MSQIKENQNIYCSNAQYGFGHHSLRFAPPRSVVHHHYDHAPALSSSKSKPPEAQLLGFIPVAIAPKAREPRARPRLQWRSRAPPTSCPHPRPASAASTRSSSPRTAARRGPRAAPSAGSAQVTAGSPVLGPVRLA
jgi:hypothetical protein